MASTSAKAKSNVVAIDHAKVQAIADRLDAENDGEEYSDPEYFDPDEPSVVLEIDASNLKFLWEEVKLFTDVPYAVLALAIDIKAGKKFDLYNFIYRWRGTIENAKGDVKEIDPSAVLKAVEKMEKKGLLKRQKVRISMDIEMKLFDADKETGQYLLPID